VTVSELNALPAGEATRLLLECCGSREWVTRMIALRPFADAEELLNEADRNWLALGEVDWLEAFAAHPRIGARTTDPTAQREQAAALSADDVIKNALALGNADYESRFGFIYIVFATGKSPQEMLELLRKRLNNDRATELRNAAAEQMKITRLRLKRVLE
jgi:2-oxo-4-hydroxy-4-carboxy-5-ureidoimidazoline decarboxylase